MNVNLGAGNDQLRTSISGFSQTSFGLNAGGGDDAILIGLLVPAVAPVPNAAVQMKVDLGPGSDSLQGHAAGFAQTTVDVVGGDGDDSALIGLLLPAVQKVRESAARMSYDLGAGNDRLQTTVTGFSQTSLNFAGGDGNDAALIGLLLPPPQAVPEATALVKFDLGGGANQLQSNVTGYPQTMVDLTAGSGNDNILIGLLLPAVQKVREAAARVNADLGDGNDQFMLRVTGFPTAAIGVDSGIGDDLVALGLLLPDGQPGDGSMAIARVDLGPGADGLMWFARGFDKVLTDFALEPDDKLIK
jgi:hypothetical protein